MREMISMMKEIMKELKEIKTEQSTYLKEIVTIKKENKELKERVVELENKMEKMDKEKRKLNIIIKGTEFEGKPENKTVQKFIEEKIGVVAKITEVQQVGREKDNRKVVRATVENMESKIRIMTNKNKLKGTRCYIDDDLTDEEQKIQKSLREIAKVEKAKGKRVVVGYQKIRIGEEWIRWHSESDKMSAYKSVVNPKN